MNIDEIKKRKAELQTELGRLEEEEEAIENASWPKRVTLFLHSDKEVLWEKGKNEIGLSEIDIGFEFKWALSEVEVVVDVFKNGTYEVVSCGEAGDWISTGIHKSMEIE